jgi:hypothetical protein
MKPLLFVTLMAVLLTSNPSVKPNGDAAKPEEASDKKSVPSIVIFNDCKTPAEATNNNKETPKWYRTVEGTNWALVFVGIFTGFAVWYQAIKTSHAAEATKKSAQATRDNIRLIIDKERARLRIQPEDFRLITPTEIEIIGAPIKMEAIKTHPIRYAVSAYAPTPAFIVEAKVDAMLSPEKGISTRPLDTKMMQKMTIPEIISAQTELLPQIALLPNISLSDEQIRKITDNEIFVHLYGFINYKDVFESPWVTRFHLYWQVAEGISKETHGEWIKCGPPKDNECT